MTAQWTADCRGLFDGNETDDGSMAWRVGIRAFRTSFTIQFGRRVDAERAAAWLNANVPLPSTCTRVEQAREIIEARFPNRQELHRRIIAECCAW